MRIILASCVFLVSFNASAVKTEEEYWKDVGLTLDQVALSTDECNESETDFISCVHGVNAALEFEKPLLQLVPTARLSAEKGFGPKKQGFGAMTIVRAKKLEEKGDAAFVKATREERKLIHDALSKLYAKNKSVDFDAIAQWLARSPTFQKNENTAVGRMLNAMMGVTSDPHTYFVPTALMTEVNTEGADDFTGIGVAIKVVEKEGKNAYIVQQPIEGGPAFKSGLRPNDIITGVDGTPTDGVDLTQLTDKIRGPKGTEVKITVKRGAEVLEFAITRDLIEQKNVASKTLADGQVGYVKLSDFMSRNSDGEPIVYSQLKEAVEELVKASPKGLVFDLRDNGGGLLTESVRVLSLFLKKGSIALNTKTLADDSWTTYRTVDSPVTDLPLVVLINARSASASEIVSGSLQDYQRAFIVGERSFGKGSVQELDQMVSIPTLLLAHTTQRFYQPSLRTNQVQGISPDLEVFVSPNPTEDQKAAFREEDEYAALPPIGNTWVQPRPEKVEQLSKCVGRGSAKSTFESAAQNDEVLPDYQLLVATDAVKCVADEKIWSPLDKAPVFNDPKSLGERALDVAKVIAPGLVPHFMPRVVPEIPGIPGL